MDLVHIEDIELACHSNGTSSIRAEATYHIKDTPYITTIHDILGLPAVLDTLSKALNPIRIAVSLQPTDAPSTNQLLPPSASQPPCADQILHTISAIGASPFSRLLQIDARFPIPSIESPIAPVAAKALTSFRHISYLHIVGSLAGHLNIETITPSNIIAPIRCITMSIFNPVDVSLFVALSPVATHVTLFVDPLIIPLLSSHTFSSVVMLSIISPRNPAIVREGTSLENVARLVAAFPSVTAIRVYPPLNQYPDTARHIFCNLLPHRHIQLVSQAEPFCVQFFPPTAMLCDNIPNTPPASPHHLLPKQAFGHRISAFLLSVFRLFPSADPLVISLILRNLNSSKDFIQSLETLTLDPVYLGQ